MANKDTLTNIISDLFFLMGNAYPHTFNKMTEDTLKQQFEFWYKSLQSFDHSLLVSTMDFYIKTNLSNYPPDIGTFIETMFRLQYIVPEFDVVWTIFESNIGKYYSEHRCWNIMPEIVQGIISARDIAKYTSLETDYSRSKFKDSIYARFNNHILDLKHRFIYQNNSGSLVENRINLLITRDNNEKNQLVIEYK
jgi:hypothetical protein